MNPGTGNATHDDSAYIAWRIIDCCLREDVRGIMHRGSEAAPAAAMRQAWPGPAFPEQWWRIAHLPGGVLWLPVQPSDYMQSLRARGDGWLRETPLGLAYEHGAEAWLALLAEGLDEETCQLHRDYAAEARCAADHRTLSRLAYQARTDALAGALDAATWEERALRCDQVASYRDHPFYPTARAKSGFGEADMRAYAPEFDPRFELRWLAVPRDALQLTTAQPTFWPGMRDVGLDDALAASHALLPVHPLTWPRLHDGDAFPLPPDTHRAPLSWLSVRPTLSVRTVMPVAYPDRHIKLPLLMRTLGALNLRLIKPSTIYDGHWFGQALTAIAHNDDALRSRYLHVDEAHGGHVEEAKHLAYLVRGYPSLPDATLVPTAALSSAMPDGRPFAAHLADRFHRGDLLAWWQAYANLLSDVHLRLWLVYGVALEANQQNCVLIYAAGQAPRLLMKDNDSARVLLPRLRERLPQIEAFGPLRDPRIPVEDDAALARMFCTIILQLDLLAVLEGIAEWQADLRQPMYAVLRQSLRTTLAGLEGQGIDTQPAERLLQSPWLPVKYLLSAGSLLSKRMTGASDINKFYGDSGPNFMLPDAATATRRQADGAA
ncbi:IucA/IucC family protein [Dyella sp. 2RAB6]|uniref:IucA/IucC family protein n=1 Tax=Dyella sp. 2RAB6 TaxID=3232992 RepID=UPI003F91CEE3